MPDRCIHGMIVSYCAACKNTLQKTNTITRVALQATQTLEPSVEDLKLKLEIKAATYVSKVTPRAIAQTKRSSDYGNKVFGDYAVVPVRDVKNPDFLSHIRENITFVHLDGHPFVWVLEFLLRNKPHIKKIRVTPRMRLKMGPAHLEILKRYGVELVEGHHRPDMSWEENENRSAVYHEQRNFILHLPDAAKKVFAELLRQGYEDAEMAARYFCINNEKYVPQMEIAKMYGYDRRGSNSHASRKINAVLYLLDPEKFGKVSKDSINRANTMARQLEEGRKLHLEIAMQRKYLKEVDLPALPEGVNWTSSAMLSKLKAVHQRRISGELDKLRLQDSKLYEIVVLRYGILDNTVRTLEEIGQLKGVTRERIRQLEALAFEELGITEI